MSCSGQIALSIKEMFAATEAVKKAQASGKTIELPPSVQAPPKAMLTQLELTRKLVFKLESDIQRLSDPGKHPQGNTQPGQVIIDIFAALNITKQSAPMLLCAFLPIARACLIRHPTQLVSNLFVSGIRG